MLITELTTIENMAAVQTVGTTITEIMTTKM
jgi:hypothetical protein